MWYPCLHQRWLTQLRYLWIWEIPICRVFGYLFGLFPVNLMHNLVHLSVGIFGIAASTTVMGARLFKTGSLAISYLLIAVMGLVPLARNNLWLHAHLWQQRLA